jgi:hypothetical protein
MLLLLLVLFHSLYRRSSVQYLGFACLAYVFPWCGQELLDSCISKNLVPSSNLILGLHRSGFAFPMNACVNELGGGVSTYLFRRAEVREDFLLFMSDSLTVTAVSQETMSLMGVRLSVFLEQCTSGCEVRSGSFGSEPFLLLICLYRLITAPSPRSLCCCRRTCPTRSSLTSLRQPSILTSTRRKLLIQRIVERWVASPGTDCRLRAALCRPGRTCTIRLASIP